MCLQPFGLQGKALFLTTKERNQSCVFSGLTKNACLLEKQDKTNCNLDLTSLHIHKIRHSTYVTFFSERGRRKQWCVNSLYLLIHSALLLMCHRRKSNNEMRHPSTYTPTRPRTRVRPEAAHVSPFLRDPKLYSSGPGGTTTAAAVARGFGRD